MLKFGQLINTNMNYFSTSCFGFLFNLPLPIQRIVVLDKQRVEFDEKFAKISEKLQIAVLIH